MKKYFLIIALVIIAALVFTGCSNTEEIEIKDIDGETIVISTEGLSDNQIDELNKLSEGEITIMDLMASDAFTRDELMDLGLTPQKDNMQGMDGNPQMMNQFSLGELDVSSLDFSTVSDEAAQAIKEAIENNLTAQELIDGGSATMQDLMAVGAIPERGMAPNGNGQRPNKEG